MPVPPNANAGWRRSAFFGIALAPLLHLAAIAQSAPTDAPVNASASNGPAPHLSWSVPILRGDSEATAKPIVLSADDPHRGVVGSTRSADARMAKAIAASAHIGILEQGIASAQQALIDCQKGDYPGGGMGLLSMPYFRPSAITDHCRR